VSENIFYTSSKGKYKEKGSSFYAMAQAAYDINDVKSKLVNIKEEYQDTNHICYAYRIKLDQRLDEFSSDAGEPKGSAGLPILNALKKYDLINAAIIVIRYFGGVKLGIPGLIHAYGTAAENAIENAELIPWLEKKHLRVTYPYELQGVMTSILKKYQVVVIHEEFGEKIHVYLEIDLVSANEFIHNINELLFGNAQIIIED